MSVRIITAWQVLVTRSRPIIVSDGQIQIVIRFKLRSNQFRLFGMTTRIFDLNAYDSTGIRFEIAI